MLAVELIRPEYFERSKDANLECELCLEMSYSLSDYKTLFVANKLAYFYIPEEDNIVDDVSVEMIVCYSCLFKYIQRVADGKNEFHLLIVDGDSAKSCTYSPEDLDQGTPHYFDFLNDGEGFGDDDEEEEDEDEDGFLPPKGFKP